jgi:hypothetical protein
LNLAVAHDDRAARIAAIQKAIDDGRRRYCNLERRATYPANPDEDTYTLAEHYRVRWHHARLLKALSYFMAVSPADLCAVSGIHPALLPMEVGKLAARVGFKIESVRKQEGAVAFYRLAAEADRDEIRAVIQSAWHFSEPFMPQSRGKKAA